jgi:hypothetical protein
MPQYLCIEFAGNFLLKFQLLESPIADLWIERMQSRGQYPLDHPDRFYSFDSQKHELARAERMIQQCIDTINAHSKIIDREFTSAHDQDLLNYLHNIFERYHGMLDQQNHEFWLSAPDTVRRALADLNLCVHRCESVSRVNNPRFVCTWYGMPKTKKLPVEQLAEYATLHAKFGTVYLNYVEIGKTLLDLATDNDQYIADEMFRPFDFYSADFNVKFYNTTETQVQDKLALSRSYFERNRDFFNQHGFDSATHPRLQPLNFPVAKLETNLTDQEILQALAQRQNITQVYLT